LSVAFHPRYAENGLLYVNYTNRRGHTHVERYQVTSDPNRADTASAHRLLYVGQPYSNHNGGHIQFGPDGYLWIGMGDGGSANDPRGFAQNPRSHLGKMLRIDVDRGDPYAIPPDNPFADGRAALPEIWASGLRNPWRFAFDRTAGMLFIADVGQDRWEEVHVAPATSPGLNYGWNYMEGNHPLRSPSLFSPRRVPREKLTPAVLEYGHGDGCSITGGFVYRGRRIPSLDGHYFYADYCQGWIRSFRYQGGSAVDRRRWDLPNVGGISSFGEDAEGELYVVAHTGTVYRIVADR
jgi:glucose/arabinose dehydrogenase